MKLSINKRIYWSFSLLVTIFVVNGLITIITLIKIDRMSDNITNVVNPSLELLDDFKKMIIESKMYTTNWVFLRANQHDKQALVRIHQSEYAALKRRLNSYMILSSSEATADSVRYVHKKFEELMVEQRKIMNQLHTFSDYDDPVKKFGAEEQIESVILPKTAELLSSITRIDKAGQIARDEQNASLAQASAYLRWLIIFLSFNIIVIGFMLSGYMTRKIIHPLNQIRSIVNDLGKGIISKVEHDGTKDEIGDMVRSVNHLSEKLQATASFARKVGNGEFDVPFEPLSNQDTLGIALIAMRDNIKSTDETLRTNNSELKKTNSELDKFVYSVSHDLRAPLTSMLGVVEIAMEDSQDEEMQEHLKMLKAGIKKLDGFILDILDYSRNARAGIRLEPIDFKDILSDISNNLKYMSSNSGRKVDIKLNIDEQSTFTSDKSRISVVLNNIISNAIRYQDPARPDPYVDISVHTTNDAAQITVKDNGIGIKKELQHKIFDMFFRVSEKSVGSGLGLYIVKETIDKLNGHIAVESEPGAGTIFNIQIPNN